ncbi:hypothetical protein NE237_008499 [Protea cynaroides]|uniref:Uncharacterized protein n=1 Tax=Protea cynaroides TaxID=273540 RepID=A0A9Q0KW50_9MAGN|nr:hypothetical protein NE237_008499 [Protea cynaroides]
MPTCSTHPKSPKYPPSQRGGKGKPPPISARKLAVTLWVMNEIPSPHMKEDVLEERRLLKKEMRGRDRTPEDGSFRNWELLKVLNRIWGLEEHHSSSMSLVSALRVEIDCARMQIEQLIQEQRSDHGEINYLMKRFAEEKAAWKTKEQERIQAAIDSIAGDLDIERKLRRRAENLNKKLGKELAETKASLSKVIKEFESERRVREVMEEACEALARNIGEDKAEVDELKRESTKVQLMQKVIQDKLAGSSHLALPVASSSAPAPTEVASSSLPAPPEVAPPEVSSSSLPAPPEVPSSSAPALLVPSNIPDVPSEDVLPSEGC